MILVRRRTIPSLERATVNSVQIGLSSDFPFPNLVYSHPYVPLTSFIYEDALGYYEDYKDYQGPGPLRSTSIYDQRLDLKCPTPRTNTYVDPSTGEITEEVKYHFHPYLRDWVPVRCNRARCPACGILMARGIALAIWLSQPYYVITLTLVGNEREVIRRRINKFVAAMRKLDPNLQYAWIVEPNPEGTGNHALLYVHVADGRLGKSVIERSWKSRVDFKRIQPNSRLTYFGYEWKCLLDPDLREVFLALNGDPTKQFLVHSSRGFWRDGRGGRVMKREDATALALKQRRRRSEVPLPESVPVAHTQQVASVVTTSSPRLFNGRPRRRITYRQCDDISDATRATLRAS